MRVPLFKPGDRVRLTRLSEDDERSPDFCPIRPGMVGDVYEDDLGDLNEPGVAVRWELPVGLGTVEWGVPPECLEKVRGENLDRFCWLELL